MRKSNWPLYIELLTRQFDPCANPLPLSIGGHLILETYRSATDDHIPECSFASDFPSAWVQVVGNGNNFTLSTCDRSTQAVSILNVLEGPTCDELECTPIQEDSDPGCAISNFANQITWSTTPGTLYRVLVSTGEHETSIGLHLKEKKVSQEESSNDTTVDEKLPPSNDQCVDAIPLQVESMSTGYTIVGSTVDATSKEDFCDDLATRGVFYSVVGTGERLVSSTCSHSTTFDAQISVFDSNYAARLDSCWGGTMNCKSRSVVDTSCEHGNAQVTSWISEMNQTYFIFVHGNDGNTTGSFGLSLYKFTGDPSPTPVPTDGIVLNNDGYENAIWVSVDGTTQYGSTVEATLDTKQVGQFCGTTISAPGVWYAMLGEGVGVRLSTCSPQTTYDTAISVFRDDGGTLRCIGGGNNNVRCGLDFRSSTVSFSGEVGVSYYILVHGGNPGDVGNFALEVSSFSLVENDDCESALPLEPDGELHVGSTLLATVEETPQVLFCGALVASSTNGVWYRAVGTGETFTVTTCVSPTTDYNTALSVFDGTCGVLNEDLHCVGGNDDDFNCQGTLFGKSTYTWQTETSKVYYILVHGSYFSDTLEIFLSGYGDFGLVLTAT